jgi:hypothetical protein
VRPAAPLPLAAEELGPALRRTRALAAILVLAGAGALAGAAALRSPASAAPGDLAGAGNRVLVVDLSGSIDYVGLAARLRPFVRGLPRGPGPGLVLFSDTAYEAFPPGTQSSALRAVQARFVQAGAGASRGLAGWRERQTPWSAFAGGTAISNGLRLAADIARRDHLRRPEVVLVSDLGDAPDDQPALRTQLWRLRRLGIRLRILGLGPSPEDRRVYDEIFGAAAVRALPAGVARAEGSSSLPVSFSLLGGAAAAVVAVLAVLAVPLDLRRAPHA